MAVDIAGDLEGVSIALAELLEESFFQQLSGRTLEALDDDDRARMLGHGPQRTLSPGYYKWANYLLELEEMRDCGAELGKLQAIEVNGLVRVRRVRHEFDVAHPLCSCGQRLESRWVPECDGCGAKFKRAS